MEDEENNDSDSKKAFISQNGGLIEVMNRPCVGNRITSFKLSVRGSQQMNISEVELMSDGKNVAKTAKLRNPVSTTEVTVQLLVMV